MPTVNKLLLDKYIHHAIMVEKLKRGEAAKVGRFFQNEVFKEVYEDIMKILNASESVVDAKGNVILKLNKRRLNEIMSSVEKIAEEAVKQVNKKLIGRLEHIAEVENHWNERAIKGAVPVEISLNLPSVAVLKKIVSNKPIAGHKLDIWLKGYSNVVRVGITKSVNKGIVLGESIPQIGKRLRETIVFKRKQAEYIARTAVSNVVHNVRQEIFEQNDDLITGIQWVSTLDKRTTIMCMNLDGKVWDIDEDHPTPPAHFNCRSTIVPVITSWKKFGIKEPSPATRASMTGEVSEKVTYKDWLKKQSKAVQEEVLGKRRAELYQSGRVKIKDFIGEDYSVLTVEEIEKKL